MNKMLLGFAETLHYFQTDESSKLNSEVRVLATVSHLLHRFFAQLVKMIECLFVCTLQTLDNHHRNSPNLALC